MTSFFANGLTYGVSDAVQDGRRQLGAVSQAALSETTAAMIGYWAARPLPQDVPGGPLTTRALDQDLLPASWQGNASSHLGTSSLATFLLSACPPVEQQWCVPFALGVLEMLQQMDSSCADRWAGLARSWRLLDFPERSQVGGDDVEREKAPIVLATTTTTTYEAVVCAYVSFCKEVPIAELVVSDVIPVLLQCGAAEGASVSSGGWTSDLFQVTMSGGRQPFMLGDGVALAKSLAERVALARIGLIATLSFRLQQWRSWLCATLLANRVWDLAARFGAVGGINTAMALHEAVFQPFLAERAAANSAEQGGRDAVPCKSLEEWRARMTTTAAGMPSSSVAAGLRPALSLSVSQLRQVASRLSSYSGTEVAAAAREPKLASPQSSPQRVTSRCGIAVMGYVSALRVACARFPADAIAHSFVAVDNRGFLPVGSTVPGDPSLESAQAAISNAAATEHHCLFVERCRAVRASHAKQLRSELWQSASELFDETTAALFASPKAANADDDDGHGTLDRGEDRPSLRTVDGRAETKRSFIFGFTRSSDVLRLLAKTTARDWESLGSNVTDGDAVPWSQNIFWAWLRYLKCQAQPLSGGVFVLPTRYLTVDIPIQRRDDAGGGVVRCVVHATPPSPGSLTSVIHPKIPLERDISSSRDTSARSPLASSPRAAGTTPNDVAAAIRLRPLIRAALHAWVEHTDGVSGHSRLAAPIWPSSHLEDPTHAAAAIGYHSPALASIWRSVTAAAETDRPPSSSSDASTKEPCPRCVKYLVQLVGITGRQRAAVAAAEERFRATATTRVVLRCSAFEAFLGCLLSSFLVASVAVVDKACVCGVATPSSNDVQQHVQAVVVHASPQSTRVEPRQPSTPLSSNDTSTRNETLCNRTAAGQLRDAGIDQRLSQLELVVSALASHRSPDAASNISIIPERLRRYSGGAATRHSVIDPAALVVDKMHLAVSVEYDQLQLL